MESNDFKKEIEDIKKVATLDVITEFKLKQTNDLINTIEKLRLSLIK